MFDHHPEPLGKLERLTQHLFLLALFSVCFSTALTNLFVGLSYISFVGVLATSAPARRAARSLPGMLALGLLALFIVGASWSVGPQADILLALKKYSRLLVLPIGITLARRDGAMADRALRYFLAGAAVLALSSYLVRFGLMPTSERGWWRVGDSRDAFAFRNHITIGIVLGYATMVCFLLASYAKTASARLAGVGAGVLFAIPILVLNQGRTGYVALFLGLVTLFLLRARLTPLRTAAGLCAICLMFGTFYAASPNFKSRTDALIHDVSTNDQHSPNGVRMSFMQTGFGAVLSHPLLGTGTGSFSEIYAPTAAKVWGAGTLMALVRHQPHSEFLLVAVQLGMLGLALYVGMLVTLGRSALGPRTFARDNWALLWIIYVSTSTFNSLLWDTTEAHWFLLLAGCLYVQCRQQPHPTP
ncbi:MAG: O-antigen ligase family protein [Massilia sp.]